MQIKFNTKTGSRDWTLVDVLVMFHLLDAGKSRKQVCALIDRTDAALGRKYRECVGVLIGSEEVTGDVVLGDEHYKRLFTKFGTSYRGADHVKSLVEIGLKSIG